MSTPIYNAADALIYTCEKFTTLLLRVHEHLAFLHGTEVIDGEEYLPPHAASLMDSLCRLQHEMEDFGIELGAYGFIDGHLIRPETYSHGGRVHRDGYIRVDPDDEDLEPMLVLQHPSSLADATEQMIAELDQSQEQDGDGDDA